MSKIIPGYTVRCIRHGWSYMAKYHVLGVTQNGQLILRLWGGSTRVFLDDADHYEIYSTSIISEPFIRA